VYPGTRVNHISACGGTPTGRHKESLAALRQLLHEETNPGTVLQSSALTSDGAHGKQSGAEAGDGG